MLLLQGRCIAGREMQQVAWWHDAPLTQHLKRRVTVGKHDDAQAIWLHESTRLLSTRFNV